MNQGHHAHSPLERFLSLFTRLLPGEGIGVVWFAIYAFFLLTSYYVLKTVRESFILTEFSPEVRSYAVGLIALLLLFIVPLYGLLSRSTRKIVLIRWVTGLFLAVIPIFYLMARADMDIGFVYFVFVGIFGVMVIAQFWAFAADSYNVKAGQRLFPIIMIGAAGGALAGAQLTKLLTGSRLVTPVGMLLISACLLALTLFLGEVARSRIPNGSKALDVDDRGVSASGDKLENALGGFAMVMRDRYLLLIALLVVLLNWVNTTGETILADFVSRYADEVSAGDPGRKGEVIAAFYGGFFFWVNLLGFVAQAFLVARVYRWIGVGGSLLVLPAIAAVGYGLMAFVPIFSIIQIVKVLENSTDYSLMNTTRQALFLPTEREVKYEGKTAIETFFWRFGDLIQAGAFYVGLNVLGLSIPQFAVLNMLLALVWLVIAYMISSHYRGLIELPSFNRAPELNRPIPNVFVPAGKEFLHTLAEDTFLDADPGDMLTLSARLADGKPLPGWLSFNPLARTFMGQVPTDVDTETVVEVVATDFAGLSVSDTFVVYHVELTLRETSS